MAKYNFYIERFMRVTFTSTILSSHMTIFLSRVYFTILFIYDGKKFTPTDLITSTWFFPDLSSAQPFFPLLQYFSWFVLWFVILIACCWSKPRNVHFLKPGAVHQNSNLKIKNWVLGTTIFFHLFCRGEKGRLAFNDLSFKNIATPWILFLSYRGGIV